MKYSKQIRTACAFAQSLCEDPIEFFDVYPSEDDKYIFVILIKKDKYHFNHKLAVIVTNSDSPEVVYCSQNLPKNIESETKLDGVFALSEHKSSREGNTTRIYTECVLLIFNDGEFKWDGVIYPSVGKLDDRYHSDESVINYYVLSDSEKKIFKIFNADTREFEFEEMYVYASRVGRFMFAGKGDRTYDVYDIGQDTPKFLFSGCDCDPKSIVIGTLNNTMNTRHRIIRFGHILPNEESGYLYIYFPTSEIPKYAHKLYKSKYPLKLSFSKYICDKKLISLSNNKIKQIEFGEASVKWVNTLVGGVKVFKEYFKEVEK